MNTRMILLIAKARGLRWPVAAALVVGIAGARVKPPVPAFASVISLAQLDAVAAGGLRAGEVTFVQNAIALSRMEMGLAQLGVSQAASSDVRTFAQQLTGDCRQIADSTDAFARRRSVAVLPPTGNASDNYRRLTEKSGVEFDQQFVRAMAAANEELLRLFEEAASNAKDPDVRDLAASNLPVLRDHVNKVRELKKLVE